MAAAVFTLKHCSHKNFKGMHSLKKLYAVNEQYTSAVAKQQNTSTPLTTWLLTLFWTTAAATAALDNLESSHVTIPEAGKTYVCVTQTTFKGHEKDKKAKELFYRKKLLRILKQT